ncbi:MAG: ECF-type sigma factor [Bryobacterales bacterium]|jgi:RNA polymerase sigma factor (TIGR02999 family)|nr:ECF-type sigma factor [Bryobacterales bacterium]
MDEAITRALADWAAGDASALHRIAPVVYPQLREIARALLSRERPGHTLQATGLVNELFLKLIAQRQPNYDHRQHFYNACAKLMRMALIDYARGAKRDKRGGGQQPVELREEFHRSVQAPTPLHAELAWLDIASPHMIDLDRGLHELARLDPQMVEMFESRYFLGCTAEEAAELTHTSKATVDRKVKLARAWLYQRLNPEPLEESESLRGDET